MKLRLALRNILSATILLVLMSCSEQPPIRQVDFLITNGLVYNGEDIPPQKLNIGLCRNIVCFVGRDRSNIKATETIDAAGLVITPGFIDPHTHSLEELQSKNSNSNINYLTQGVTTVIAGNDGGGSPYIGKIREQLSKNGIGTNVGLLVGHGSVREIAMGRQNAEPNSEQMRKMKGLVESAFKEGALGFSTGLYYVPGRYANIDEVIELAKIAAKHNSLYESHIRDESTFNIGFLAAIREVVRISEQAKIPAHIAHIKALGVDVWGQSKQAIEIIHQAQLNGVKITADQYPWQASGTFLHSAVIPAWVMADSHESFLERLRDPELLPRIKLEIAENIRRRGGGSALLITATKNGEWLGKSLSQIANDNNVSEVDAVIKINSQEAVRVASFNMSETDIESFMTEDWVVSSSDGTNGHPRKYASFPRKYEIYVNKKELLSMSEFVHKSSGKTADIFRIKNRGYLKQGFLADINIIDIKNYKAHANFSKWNSLSTGIKYQFVNGSISIRNNEYTGHLSGVVL